MIKRFCDLCEEPAEDGMDVAYVTPQDHATGKPQIVVKASFGYGRQTIGEPPDLCAKCRYELLKKLADQHINF